MAETYGPFDSGAGANQLTEAYWNLMFGHIAGPGVLAGELNELAVSADGGGMRVFVATGKHMALGTFYTSDAQQTLAISPADATLARIDLVVARYNLSANTVALAVLEGTPAATPAEPTLTQSSTTYEVLLAKVAVAAAASVINAANVTDRRYWTRPDMRGVPYVSVFRGLTSQTGVVSGTPTPIAWDSIEYRPMATMWSASAPTKLIALMDGVYHIKSVAAMDSNASGYRALGVRVTTPAGVVGPTRTLCHEAAYASMVLSGSDDIYMAAGSQVEIMVTHNSGTDRTIIHSANVDYTRASMRLVR